MRQIGPSSGNTTTNLSCQDLPVKDVGLQQEIKHAIVSGILQFTIVEYQIMNVVLLYV